MTIADPFAVHHSDAASLAATLPDGCASLLWCDIPYHGAISAEWDNAWATDAAFLAWVGEQCAAWRRVLAANGSLYVFCSPAMAWEVEGVVRAHFEVLNAITWAKPGAVMVEKYGPENFRHYVEHSERILFCEQRGSDSTAIDASGYGSKCEEAKRTVIGDYLRAEFERACVTNKRIAALFPSKTGGLTGCVSNWLLGFNMPTAEQYATMRSFTNREGAAEGRPYLRADYEALRADYEALRRPFQAVPERPYTDVWTFPTVQAYEGKHPCEKPPEMCEHAVLTSSRPGDLIVDLYCGSGAMGSAALANGRRFLGGDADARWAEHARRRCEMTLATGRTATRSVVVADPRQGRLF